jgi:hypothetical protein
VRVAPSQRLLRSSVADCILERSTASLINRRAAACRHHGMLARQTKETAQRVSKPSFLFAKCADLGITLPPSNMLNPIFVYSALFAFSAMNYYLISRLIDADKGLINVATSMMKQLDNS